MDRQYHRQLKYPLKRKTSVFMFLSNARYLSSPSFDWSVSLHGCFNSSATAVETLFSLWLWRLTGLGRMFHGNIPLSMPAHCKLCHLPQRESVYVGLARKNMACKSFYSLKTTLWRLVRSNPSSAIYTSRRWFYVVLTYFLQPAVNSNSLLHHYLV